MGLLDEEPEAVTASTPTPSKASAASPVATETKKEEPKKDERVVTDETINSWFVKRDKYKAKKVCMVLGEDGTGKSGLVLHHIAEQLRKDKTATAMIIDLDQGVLPLMDHYLDVSDRLIVRDPAIGKILRTDNDIEIDWKGIMNEMVAIANFVAKNYETKNIKYFVLDGLSKLLEVAEDQMRVDRFLQLDGGANQAYWKLRKKYFFKVLNMMKTISIDSFFIGHNNFIMSDKSAAVQVQTNAMMFQRIICSKVEINSEVKLQAKVTKSKLNPLKEGFEETFMHKKDDKVVFDSTKIFEGL